MIQRIFAKRGFTLIELLTVILIIGILASIGLYGYNQFLIRSRDAKRINDLETIKSALERFFADNRYYPFFEKYHHGVGTGDFAMPAKFQLQNITPRQNGCLQVRDKLFLVPNYLTTIPEDPLYRFKYSDSPTDCDFNQLTTKSCNSENTNCQYLYIADNIAKFDLGPQEPNKVELRSARSFMLIAATERARRGDYWNTDFLNDTLVNITDSDCEASTGSCPCNGDSNCREEECYQKKCGSCTGEWRGMCVNKCLRYQLTNFFQSKGYKYFLFPTKND